jgi:hypothetical protein
VVKLSELEIWSLQISSFQRNSSSYLSSLLFRTIQIESIKHAESTGDAQEKQARSYELEVR